VLVAGHADRRANSEKVTSIRRNKGETYICFRR
jgi:hypothetical protein